MDKNQANKDLYQKENQQENINNQTKQQTQIKNENINDQNFESEFQNTKEQNNEIIEKEKIDEIEDDYDDYGLDFDNFEHLDYDSMLEKQDIQNLENNQITEQNECKEIVQNRSSVYISRMGNDKTPQEGCDYCKTSNLQKPENLRSDQKYCLGGFSTGKFRIDDFEHALNMGACRSGDHIYFRNQRTSCCEVWNYRVQIDKVKLQKQQKKAMRRFQRYLQVGPTDSQKLKEKEQVDKYKLRIFEQYVEKLQEKLKSEYIYQEFQDKVIVLSDNENFIARFSMQSIDEQTNKILINLLKLFVKEEQSNYKSELTTQEDQQCLNVDVKLLFEENFIKYIQSQPIDLSIQEEIQKLPKYPNEFLLQFEPYDPSTSKNQQKKTYSIHLYKSHFNEEMFELTKDYEVNVHKRSLSQSNKKFVQEFMSNSPLYDQNDQKQASVPSKWDNSSSESNDKLTIHQILKQNESQYPPSVGSYHLYHRIDGELVAIGVIELTQTYFNSGYFIYKTKYSYLNLGVVGAMIELEYCRKLKDLWQQSLFYYHLGELVIDCPKVNYKLNYQPGQVLCPYSKQWVNYEDAKPEILKIMAMKKEEKILYQISQDLYKDQDIEQIIQLIPLRIHPDPKVEFFDSMKQESTSTIEIDQFLTQNIWQDLILELPLILYGMKEITINQFGPIQRNQDLKKDIKDTLLYFLRIFGPDCFLSFMIEYKSR